MGQDAISIFGESNWKASEEIALLEAVELYGLGNWNEIANLVGTTRSPDEVCDHFFTHYVNGPIGRVARNLQAREDVVRPKDHTCSKGDTFSPFFTKSLPVIPQLTVDEQQSLGYMPKRDDFEREFDNDAEKLISTLRIIPGEDDPLEIDLKLAHIDMYNRRLRERCRTKSIVREYGLVSQFYQSLEKMEEKKSLINGSASSSSSLNSPCSNTDVSSSPLPHHLLPYKCDNISLPITTTTTTKRSNGCFVKTGVILYHRFEKQLYKKFRILSQLQSALDQKTLVENLKREKELKARIKDLHRLRKNGIRKVCEIASFEAARRKRRDKRKENKKKKFAGRKYSLRSQGSCDSGYISDTQPSKHSKSLKKSLFNGNGVNHRKEKSPHMIKELSIYSKMPALRKSIYTARIQLLQMGPVSPRKRRLDILKGI